MDDMETCPMPHMYMEAVKDEMAAKASIQEEHASRVDDTQVYECEAGSGLLVTATIQAASATKAITKLPALKDSVPEAEAVPANTPATEAPPKKPEAPASTSAAVEEAKQHVSLP